MVLVFGCVRFVQLSRRRQCVSSIEKLLCKHRSLVERHTIFRGGILIMRAYGRLEVLIE